MSFLSSTLLIFDEHINVANINIIGANKNVVLFPLTSNSDIKNRVETMIKQQGGFFEEIPAAKLIHASSQDVKRKFIHLISNARKINIHGRNLVDWFSIDRHVSLWWLGLIAEKNTFKSEGINRLMQLDAIVQVIQKRNIKKIYCSAKSRRLENTLYEYSQKKGLAFQGIPTCFSRGVLSRLRHFQKFFYIKHMLLLLITALKYGWRSRRIKKNIQGVYPQTAKSYDLLMVTAYPQFSIPEAKKGHFKNVFYPHIQESLEAKHKKILWLAHYTESNFISFDQTFEYARAFLRKGYPLHFIESQVSIGMLIRGVLTMGWHGLKFLRIQKQIRQYHTFGSYPFYALFKDDWYSSFVGAHGFMGVVFYHAFRRFLTRFDVPKGLYVHEMHALEKALILARDSLNHPMKLYGYQHGTISNMLLNFFNAKDELSEEKNTSIPKPDKLLCNGKYSFNLMKNIGWSEKRLQVVEAIRYLYLKKLMDRPIQPKKNIILFATSIHVDETISILNVITEAALSLTEFEFWLKPHPALEFKKLSQSIGRSIHELPFTLKTEPLSELLSETKIVISGQSGVGLEALASGCYVIGVNVPEWINMSPLLNIQSTYIGWANSTEELVARIRSISDERGHRLSCDPKSLKEIIDSHFYLGHPQTPVKQFLDVLNSCI